MHAIVTTDCRNKYRSVCVCVCVCLWEEEKKERVLGIEMAFVRGHMHRCLNTCACLA